MWILRVFMLLALIVWVGGIIFFAFVMAPTLFTVLPSTRLAGDVVSPALRTLHWMGLVSGGLFLLCSLGYNWLRYAQLRVFTATHVFIALMLALTAVSQFAVTPRMQELRGSAGAFLSSQDRQDFDRLHAWSTRLEGGVLLLGLGVVILAARGFENR